MIGTGAAVGTGTIVNDDSVSVPSMTISKASMQEGNSGASNLSFTVTLSTATTVPVSVNYVTSNGSAQSGTDFQGTSGTVTIPAGSTSGTIQVSVFGDLIIEPDETFSVSLSSASNATLLVGTATGTIVNDDSGPTITIGNASVVEGNSGSKIMTFPVTLSNAASTAVTVNYETSGVSATSGVDFVATSGILTIPAGSTTVTILVPVVGDTVVESNETFAVTLSNASSNASIGTAGGTGTIADDDAPSTIEMSVADVSYIEGNANWNFMNFEVLLSAPLINSVSVFYFTTDITARSRGNTADYRAAIGTLEIPAGQRRGLISVSVKGDGTLEADETFALNLGEFTGVDFVLGEWTRISRKPRRSQ